MVFVINKNGKPLIPCSPTKAKHLLKASKAKCIKRTPFTIKLLWDCEENIQEVIAGMDTGFKTIGCAVIVNSKVVYQSEIQIRQDISSKMEQRKMYRRNRRSRKIRYREARWANRASTKRKGRLAPSILSKVNSHLREKQFVESILPVSKWILELASFDIHKISNSGVEDYQKGQQKGFYNTKAYILYRDNYQCQKCKTHNVKLHVHHIIFRSNGGTNSPENLITLCKNCHDRLHNDEFVIKGIKSKTKHATEIGIIKAQLKKKFGDFAETFGYETKFKREQILYLEKSHRNDAIAICCDNGEVVGLDSLVYFKKHVAKGDYRQTKGSRSEKKIPTGKLFGLRKFDLIETSKGIGFVKGKRSDGRFAICDIFWNEISGQVQIKKFVKRISARSTILIMGVEAHSATRQAYVVPCA